MIDSQTRRERIGAVLLPFKNPNSRELGAVPYPLLDIDKPNIHDSKADFLSEKQAVAQATGSLRSVIELFYPRIEGGEDAAAKAQASRLRDHIDAEARANGRKRPISNPIDLVLKNAAEVGVTDTLVFISVSVWSGLQSRARELEDQEKEFWSGTSRPPNHYARTIALRVARYIAQETGEVPTMGISREGNHPSTDYGRALEEIFSILKLEANFRRPGQWAISQLTEQDLKKPYNALRGLPGTYAPPPPDTGTNVLAGLLQSLSEGDGT